MAYAWSQLEEIFDECLKLPASEREKYILNKAGNNLQLKETLIAMLRNSGEEENYFQHLQGGIANALQPNNYQKEVFTPGDVIGKYKIQTLLDKGGMGQVYLASRNDGQYEQNVAIKCFSNTAINKKNLERFRQEQQFLATLNHGNIVHIIDGGTINEIPYIIMDFVEGIPIDQYLKEKLPAEKDKIALFLEICETIQFAHNHLILHLDIKPNNILVSEGGKVKLLDFGISRKTDASNEASEKLMATPIFAAPEQLKREPVSVATDVYQLGVLLHLILSGEIPFAINQDMHHIRIIHINKLLIPPELRSILIKCLKSNPLERYTSAYELSEEIEKYKNNYPIAVHSKSLIYKSTRFFKRNKISSFLTLIVITSLSIGIISSERQAKIAQEQTIKAELAAKKSGQVSQFLISIFESANPELRGTEKVEVEQILQESINKIKLYPDDPLKAELLSVLGTTLSRAGKYELADSLLSQSILLFEKFDNINSEAYFMAHYELSKSRMYNSQLEASISIVKAGLNKLPSNDKGREQISGILNLQFALVTMEAGSLNKADSIFTQSKSVFEQFTEPLRKAEVYNVKASILNYKGDFDSAIFYLKKSLVIVERNYSSNHTFYLTISENLASAYRQMGNFKEALEIKKETIVKTEEIFGKNHLEYIKSANGLGLIYKDFDSLDLAYQYLKEAVDLTESVLGEYTLAFISSAGNLALVLSDLQHFPEAELFSQRANENAKKLVGEEHPFYLWSLGIYADALADSQKTTEAERIYHVAIAEQTRLMGAAHPWVKKSKRGLASLYKRESSFHQADSLVALIK
jgi:serine/threonine-protein kinase